MREGKAQYSSRQHGFLRIALRLFASKGKLGFSCPGWPRWGFPDKIQFNSIPIILLPPLCRGLLFDHQVFI